MGHFIKTADDCMRVAKLMAKVDAEGPGPVIEQPVFFQGTRLHGSDAALRYNYNQLVEQLDNLCSERDDDCWDDEDIYVIFDSWRCNRWALNWRGELLFCSALYENLYARAEEHGFTLMHQKETDR